MNFIKNLLTTTLGFFVAIFLLLTLVVFIGIAIGEESKIVVAPDSVLKIELASQIKDYAPKSNHPIDELIGYKDNPIGLNTAITAIENAKEDSNIKGISIQIKRLNAGISQVKEIRKALEDFKNSGKFIMAYADYYGQKEYYLSSVADSLFVNPMGGVNFRGLISEVLFFKDFQDKLGIKMEVVRHGKYKSAVEPFLENKMTAENKLQLSELLASLWSSILDEISLSRKIDFQNLNTIADGLKGRTAEFSFQNHLVDGVLYEDAYIDKLKRLTQKNSPSDSFKSLNLVEYIASGKGRIFKSSSNKIAVIYAQGDIIYGKGDEDYIGQGMIIETLEKVRKDKKVKAVVLRVNTPGGDALASDLIWRALELTKTEKPLVVSMGDYATSGGYYISCNANKIIAEPTTITGSIGVFGLFPNVSSLSDKLGIHAEFVKTNKAPSYSVFNPMESSFYNYSKESVTRVYKTFVTKVSKGRKMTYEDANALAQGRVWSGKQALENGLIDTLGGLDIAIKSAADLAGISAYKIASYPSYKKDLREVFQDIPFVNSKKSFFKEWLGIKNYRFFKDVNSLREVRGIQARLPYILSID